MKVPLFIFLFAISLNSTAQHLIIPKDEAGKYTFSEITETPGFNAQSLFENAESFIAQVSNVAPNIQSNTAEAEYTLKNQGNFSVHDFGLKKHIAGRVSFEIIIEIKDAKYRYTITNYIFSPYERNRYGKYEPVNGKDIPMETESTKLNRKNWNNYLKEVYTKSLELIEQLNTAMNYVKPTEAEKIKKESSW